jgi:hypothetical protein
MTDPLAGGGPPVAPPLTPRNRGYVQPPGNPPAPPTQAEALPDLARQIKILSDQYQAFGTFSSVSGAAAAQAQIQALAAAAIAAWSALPS